jgi:hypothetical protein
VSGKSANFHHVHGSAPGEQQVLTGAAGFAASSNICRKYYNFRPQAAKSLKNSR